MLRQVYWGNAEAAHLIQWIQCIWLSWILHPLYHKTDLCIACPLMLVGFSQQLAPRGGGGSLQLRLYESVQPHYWKIDPSADKSWPIFQRKTDPLPDYVQ